MYKQPKVSVCVPIHDMKDGDRFLWRLVNSLTSQTFTDWELIITKDGKMAENTNSAIKKAHGEYIKILYLDDYFAHPSALQHMVEVMDYKLESDWLITATDTNVTPQWTDDIETGNNKLGSPSALMMRNDIPLLFDEKMSWLLDCDLYKRLYRLRSKPIILEDINICIGQGDHQMTHILTDEEKLKEHTYMNEKYGK